MRVYTSSNVVNTQNYLTIKYNCYKRLYALLPLYRLVQQLTQFLFSFYIQKTLLGMTASN